MKPAVSNHAINRFLERVLEVNATAEDIPADAVTLFKTALSELARLPPLYPRSWLTWKKRLGGFIYVVDRGCVITILRA